MSTLIRVNVSDRDRVIASARGDTRYIYTKARIDSFARVLGQISFFLREVNLKINDTMGLSLVNVGLGQLALANELSGRAICASADTDDG